MDGSDLLQSVDIYTVAKNYSVFIQTDKAIYKPGDKVQFRVIVLDAETRPYQSANVDIKITDSNGNDLYKSVDDELDNLFAGVYNATYELSDSPSLGIWRIHVKISSDDDLTSRSFEVTESVLPRFSAQLESNSDVLLSDGKIKLAVFGEYSFGEFVQGNASVSAEVFQELKPDIIQMQKNKSANVSARKNVEFEFNRELRINSSSLIRVNLTIEENLTGKKATTSKIIRVHKTAEYKVKLISSDNQLKPGFPYKIKAIVTKFDGSLEMSQAHKVKFDVVYYKLRNRNAEKLINVESTLKSGTADCMIAVPLLARGVTVTLSYLDSRTSVNMSVTNSKSDRYLKIHVEDKKYENDKLRLD